MLTPFVAAEGPGIYNQPRPPASWASTHTKSENSAIGDKTSLECVGSKRKHVNMWVVDFLIWL